MKAYHLFIVFALVCWSAYQYGYYLTDWHPIEVQKIGILGIVFVIASIVSFITSPETRQIQTNGMRT